ncbi:MAG: hypothetical protein IJO70_11345 [Lachnospiraceae bacterium]|nr:hypothetical protein [Lachnospiraceae bacterium]
MSGLEKFKQYNLENTAYDYIDCYVVDEHDFCGLNYHGDLNDDECEYKHYDMSFWKISDSMSVEKINMYQKGTLKSIKIDGNQEEGYSVQMELENPAGKLNLDFKCGSCNIHFLRYRGVDYTNVYGSEKYNEYIKEYLCLEDEKYFEDEYVIEISHEFSLVQKNYLHEDGMKRISMSRNYLQRNGENIYSYILVDGHHRPYKQLIHHKNGHRYYPHHVDLYGISYIDVDTLEVFNYMPRGYDNDYGLVCGESFIIVSVHYDENTNLVAYEGCYWAGTYDVMVGDLSNPLDFNPRLISIHKMLDSEYEEFDDVDFGSWNKDSLSVKIDDREVRSIEIEKLRIEG